MTTELYENEWLFAEKILLEKAKLEEENKQLKELKYKFFDNCGDEESFTLEDYLDISNKLYEYEQENKQLKEEIKKYINSSNFVYDELYKKRETIEKILGDNSILQVQDKDVKAVGELIVEGLKEGLNMNEKGDKEND